ncbi:MAG: cation diffusion facilitator family transporter, partial [Gammaproteobacteria bacterium]|nr:cation diffusion facilitator family transporter [Gammaproteobacteria bacterium]NIW86482.1 cation diffusion facilitator family transporter [Gammaproteobacteria bacterium]
MAREQTLHEAAQPASGAKGSVAGGAPAERSRVARRVTLVGIAANLTLALMQVVIGWLGRSQALVADGVHTLSDLTTDVIVLLAVGKGAKAADEEHPYGHSRFETLATAAVGFILIAVALGLSINAGRRLMDPEHLAVPAAYTLIAVIMTILTKEGLYRYAMRAAREHRSNLLRANAWHYRSDAISSVVVLLGIGGSLVGFRYLDAVAAVGVAMMIAKIGWDLAWEALQELVDKGLSAEEREAIRATIMAVDGAKDMHLLRTRRMGGQALVDVHIQVDGAISVSEGHHISEMVRHLLIEQHESITDVTVHIDPEDDEITPSSLGLPLRN